MQRWAPWSWLSGSVIVLLLDQWSKHWAVQALAESPLRVFAWLNFRLAYNTGAAFSFMANAGGWQAWVLLILPLLVCVGLVVWLWRTPASGVGQALGLCLIIGGALGNVTDRFRLGYVVDFIDCHWFGWHFATFNLADSAVCVGAGVLMLTILRAKENSDENKIS